ERSHWSGNGVHVESELVFMIGRNMQKVIAAFNEKVNTDSDVEHAISAGVSVFDDLVLISKRLPV
ncbi:hypothetical protein ACV1CZ_22560, partial [Aeromonas caviae]